MPQVVLLRHGESDWNLSNRFSGWTDVDLTDTGREEATRSGQLLVEEGLHVRRGVHVSSEARHPHPLDRP